MGRRTFEERKRKGGKEEGGTDPMTWSASLSSAVTYDEGRGGRKEIIRRKRHHGKQRVEKGGRINSKFNRHLI